MMTAWIGMGANVGDRLGSFRAALAELESLDSTEVVRVSSVYDTAPWGVTDQERFLNAVVEIRTELSAGELLSELLRIEGRCGRVRYERWGPRTLDLDILLYGDEIIVTDELTVPHPRLAQRAFVLMPLAELEPTLVVPGLDSTVAALLDELGDEAADVERLGPPPGTIDDECDARTVGRDEDE